MIRFLKRVHTYWMIFSIAISYYSLYPFVYYYTKKPERYKKLNLYRRIFAFMSSALAGIFYNYTYETDIDWTKNYIICPNHTSNLDSTAITLMGKSNIFFMGKDELLKNPVTKLWFKTIDVPVNRDSKMSAFRAFQKVSERLKTGLSLVLFPEGKIGENYPPTLHSFKNGAFKMAIENKTPILPVSIIDGWQLQWDDGMKLGSNPGICHIYVHKPIETVNLLPQNEEELRDLVYQTIASRLEY